MELGEHEGGTEGTWSRGNMKMGLKKHGANGADSEGAWCWGNMELGEHIAESCTCLGANPSHSIYSQDIWL